MTVPNKLVATVSWNATQEFRWLQTWREESTAPANVMEVRFGFAYPTVMREHWVLQQAWLSSEMVTEWREVQKVLTDPPAMSTTTTTVTKMPLSPEPPVSEMQKRYKPRPPRDVAGIVREIKLAMAAADSEGGADGTLRHGLLVDHLTALCTVIEKEL